MSFLNLYSILKKKLVDYLFLLKTLVLSIRKIMCLFYVLTTIFTLCLFCSLNVFIASGKAVSVTNTQEIMENFVFIKTYVYRINNEILIPNNLPLFSLSQEDMFALSALPISKNDLINLIYYRLRLHLLNCPTNLSFFTLSK